MYRVIELAQGFRGYLITHESVYISYLTSSVRVSPTNADLHLPPPLHFRSHSPSPVYFLLLDSLPLLFAISIYIPFWPTKLFPLLNNAYRPAIRVESPTALQTLPLGRRSSFTPPYDGRPLGRGESEGSKVEK